MVYQDNELIDNMNDNSEEARDVLYEKYKYIVDVIINKYKKMAYYLNIDMQELRQEALLGFSDALYSFNYDKNANLPTFISLCVDRRVDNYVKKHNTVKMRMLKEMISLDDMIGDDISLMDVIGDDTTPEDLIEDKEESKALMNDIKKALSDSELEIYKLLVNNFSYDDIGEILNMSTKQIYDSVYRIRKKLKDLY